MTALEDVLRDREWSKTKLSKESGVTVRTINRWLAGREPHPRSAQAVAYALGEPVERLTTLPQPRSALEAAMDVSGRTTNDLARAVGVNPATISYLRSGARQPHPESARAIADAMGRPIDELFPDRAANARTPFAAAIATSGFSQGELARQAGVGLTALKTWASGSATPGVEKAEAVARVLGQPVEELFTSTASTTRQDLPLVPVPPKTLTPDQVLAADATRDPKWAREGLCATGDHDRELWFPETPGQATKARQVCATCPVVGDCRDAFLTAPVVGLARQEMDRGIWAGVRGSQLRQAARQTQHERTTERAAQHVVEAVPEPEIPERTRPRAEPGRVMSA